MSQSFRLVFMGSPEFAQLHLKALHQKGHEILAVVTQPDRKKGRGQKTTPTSCAQYATKHGLQLFKPQKLNLESPCFLALKKLSFDFLIVVAFGQILSQEVLDLAKVAPINVHASLLPHWRGAAPIQRALMAGDTKTGICLMKMEKGLDTGPIFFQEEILIDPTDNQESLTQKLITCGSELLVKKLPFIFKNPTDFKAQNNECATYAKKIDKAEARINWQKEAAELFNQIRGLNPWPGAYFEHSKKRIKVLETQIHELNLNNSYGPGQKVGLGEEGPIIQCGKNQLELCMVKPEGKKNMAGKDWFLGNPFESL